MAGRVQLKQFVAYSVDYEQSLLSSSVEQNARDTQMIASRGFAARLSRERALLSLNLKKRRDCSQSTYSVLYLLLPFVQDGECSFVSF